MRYATIVADPPWPIPEANRRAGNGRSPNGRATALPYPLMSLDEIAALPVSDLALPNAHLYLWVTPDFNRRGVGVRIAEAWGFRVVSEIIWEKLDPGMGAFPRSCHEPILICSRGKLPFATKNVRSVQRWSRRGFGPHSKMPHSVKPSAFFDLVEQTSPAPRLELFSRRRRLGWDVMGFDVTGRSIEEELSGRASIA